MLEGIVLTFDPCKTCHSLCSIFDLEVVYPREISKLIHFFYRGNHFSDRIDACASQGLLPIINSSALIIYPSWFLTIRENIFLLIWVICLLLLFSYQSYITSRFIFHKKRPFASHYFFLNFFLNLDNRHKVHLNPNRNGSHLLRKFEDRLLLRRGELQHLKSSWDLL